MYDEVRCTPRQKSRAPSGPKPSADLDSVLQLGIVSSYASRGCIKVCSRPLGTHLGWVSRYHRRRRNEATIHTSHRGQCVISVTAAMDMAVGKESLDDWPKVRFSGLVSELRCRRLRTSSVEADPCCSGRSGGQAIWSQPCRVREQMTGRWRRGVCEGRRGGSPLRRGSGWRGC